MSILNVENLSVKRPDRVIRGIDFILNEDETLVIYSLNTDSSFVLDSLYNIRNIIEGSILYDSDDLLKYDYQDLENLHSTDFSFIQKDSALLEEFTLIENLTMVQEMNEVEWDRQMLEKLVKSSGLKEYLSSPPSRLSELDKRKAIIIRSVIKRPFVLFVDDLTHGLDEDSKEKLMSFLNGINGIYKIPMIHSTNDRKILNYGSKRIAIENGNWEVIR